MRRLTMNSQVSRAVAGTKEAGVTSGGNYPPGPYPGSYGYPPEGDDNSEQSWRDDHPANGPDPSERDAEPGSSVSGAPNSGLPAPSPAVARAAISTPGLRVEPPADGQPGPAAAGQVYGRPSPTTYGRPASPAPVVEPEPPAHQAADARDFAGPGQPRVYGQPQRSQPIEPEDQPYDSDARRGARPAVPRQFDDQNPDSWDDEREDPPSWQQSNDARSWEQGAEAPSWQRDNGAPPWQPGNDRGPTSGPAERTPGLYGHAAATSSPAPQPLYGGAPPVPPPPPADASSGRPAGQPGPSDANSDDLASRPGPAEANSNGLPPRPAAAAGNSHPAGVPGANGPAANAFGPGVYGAGVYGAATYGTPRDLGSQDDSASRNGVDAAPSRNGADPAPGRNGFVDPGEARYGLARPAAPASSHDAPGDHDNQINGAWVNDNQVNDNQVNHNQVNGGRVNGNPANGNPTPDSPPARPGGVVYGTPRVYGSPRPTPADDDAGDSPADFDDRPEPNRFDDRPESNRLDDRREPNRFDDRPESSRFDDRREPNRLADRPGSISDLPPRAFGEVPGRAVADMPRRPAPGDGIGRPGDAMDRARADDAMPPTALGRPVSAWPGPPRPEFNAVAPETPTSPAATRLGQTYGSSRPPIDWNVPEQDNRARFDSPVAPGEGVRIPTGTSSFTSLGSGGEGGGGGRVAPGPDIRPAPEPRRWTRTAGIVAIVVIVIGLAAGALYYTSRPNAPSYQIGSCVQHSGEKVNGSACTAPNSFKIVSKVSDPSACPNANDPYLYLGNDRSTVYCLAPN